MRRGLLLLLVGVLLVAVPAGLLVWTRTQTKDHLSGLEPDPVPLVVPVEELLVDDLTAVSAAGSWSVPEVVVAPGWSGTVVRVFVEPDDVVASGDVIAKVDGIDRVAAATADPFWRRLRRRDEGLDVAQLQMWLGDLSYYEGDIDGVFGRELQAAVKAWAGDIGVGKPDGSFDPAWVVWLPVDQFVADQVNLAPSAPAPGAGQVILVGPSRLVSVAINDENDRPARAAGAWVLQVGDVEVPVIDGLIDENDLAGLRDVMVADEPSAGRLRRAEPITVLTVPATAVVSNSSGELCVFVPADGNFASTPVEVSGGRVATVTVASGLRAGDQVLANPSDMYEAPDCP